MPDGILLSRLSKGIPAHRMQHVISLHAFEARDYISWDIVAAMTDMETITRRVGKEIQAVILRSVTRFLREIETLPLPKLLPLWLDLARMINWPQSRLVHLAVPFLIENKNPSPDRDEGFLRGTTLLARIRLQLPKPLWFALTGETRRQLAGHE
jgi:hypothetical protein